MRKLFLVLLMTLAVSLTANLLLYSETDTSTSQTPQTAETTAPVNIDEEWLLEDGMPGVNIFPYDAGSYNVYFPWSVVIMSESDARWIFSTLKNHDIEVAEWKKRLETEVGLHNETILERNDFAGRYTTWRKIATYGVPSGIFAGLIFGLLLGG